LIVVKTNSFYKLKNQFINMLNQSLRIRLLVLGLLIFSVNIISAQEDDNLGTEVVNIIKPYNPTISDAFKVKENPLIKDSIMTKKKELNYTIFSVPVASTFTPANRKNKTANTIR